MNEQIPIDTNFHTGWSSKEWHESKPYATQLLPPHRQIHYPSTPPDCPEVPEPATWLLMGLGLVLILLWRRYTRNV